MVVGVALAYVVIAIITYLNVWVYIQVDPGWFGIVMLSPITFFFVYPSVGFIRHVRKEQRQGHPDIHMRR